MHPFQKIIKGIDKITYTLRLIQVDINNFKNGPLIDNGESLFNELLKGFSEEFQDRPIYVKENKKFKFIKNNVWMKSEERAWCSIDFYPEKIDLYRFVSFIDNFIEKNNLTGDQNLKRVELFWDLYPINSTIEKCKSILNLINKYIITNNKTGSYFFNIIEDGEIIETSDGAENGDLTCYINREENNNNELFPKKSENSSYTIEYLKTFDHWTTPFIRIEVRLNSNFISTKIYKLKYGLPNSLLYLDELVKKKFKFKYFFRFVNINYKKFRQDAIRFIKSNNHKEQHKNLSVDDFKNKKEELKQFLKYPNSLNKLFIIKKISNLLNLSSIKNNIKRNYVKDIPMREINIKIKNISH